MTDFIGTDLPEVRCILPRFFPDARGVFWEAWQSERYVALGVSDPFVQDNLSRSHRGVLRGLHYQLPTAQGKLVSALEGEVFDVAVDIRRGSPTFGRWTAMHLSSANGRQLYIPVGFAHGFLALTDNALVQYKCSTYYRPAEEKTIRWDDPDLGITWPAMEPLVSEKDQAGQWLRDLTPDALPAFP